MRLIPNCVLPLDAFSNTQVLPLVTRHELSDSGLEGADVLDGAGKPKEQAKDNEIKVCRDIILHIPREQAKEDEIEV
jgi:hypothetical protein